MPPRHGDSSPEAEQLNAANLRALEHFGISFQPKDTQADDSELRSAADSLGTFAMRVLGRSDDLGGQFDQLPQDFTEAVAWDIHDQANYNDGLWKDTAYAVNFSQKETESWADQVEDFLDKRTKLIEEWESAVDTAVTRKNTLIDEAEIPSDLSAEERKDFEESVEEGAAETAKAELEDDREALRTRDRNNHDTLLDEAEAHGDRLAEGPTPDNVERLVNTGHMNWSGFNIKGEEAALPVTPERAERDARVLGRYLGGDGKESDEDYRAALSLLQSLNAGSFAFQNDKSRHAVIEYLETLYGDLEEQAGATGIPRYIGGSDELVAEDLSPLADGILILSDTEKGGSFDALPQSVQNVALGPGHGQTDYAGNEVLYDLSDYQGDIPDFARLMRASDPDLQGGYGFSLNMTSAIGGHLERFGDSVVDDLAPDLGALLDISTRNEDANHGLLTGEGGQHPSIDREDAIAGLFTHDWYDNGESAAGLVDWIPEDALNKNNPKARDLAGDAAAGLLETITSDDMYEKLTDTGATIGDDSDASVGAVNGRIAEGFTNIFMNYIDEFAAPDGMSQLENLDGSGEISRMSEWNSSHFELRMDPVTRVRFLEYAAGDPDSAIRAQAASTAYNDQMITRYLTTDAGVPASAEPAGTLQGLVDAAVNNEAMDRLGDEEKANEERARIRSVGMGIADHAVGKIPYVGGPLGGVFMEEIDNAMKQKSGEDFSYNSQTNNGEFIRDR
ncbi:TPR repeat region-containing protein [Halostreptopolyspora alba]|uniref:TPR repeat domain-containing protein n=1 Tax=Halostreptopolyspora alba TaxID=2487137 RepID=A0A3N0E3V2_9ACTN|nr:hypothetical protein EFW17_18740 [Nocardiopsaceae bacterium YIM 96095]